MDAILRSHAEQIVKSAIGAVLPDEAVIRALEGKTFPGKVILVAAGKAAWQMANAAWSVIGETITSGIVITKYDHVKGPIGNLLCLEAGHPVPDVPKVYKIYQMNYGKTKKVFGNQTTIILWIKPI